MISEAPKYELWTDNPASNRLYQRIGFEQVGQIAEYKMGKKFHT
ncbi:MAG: GNAT family N-acetyltransferase [Lachnospiraceae bacterium]